MLLKKYYYYYFYNFQRHKKLEMLNLGWFMDGKNLEFGLEDIEGEKKNLLKFSVFLNRKINNCYF